MKRRTSCTARVCATWGCASGKILAQSFACRDAMTSMCYFVGCTLSRDKLSLWESLIHRLYSSCGWTASRNVPLGSCFALSKPLILSTSVRLGHRMQSCAGHVEVFNASGRHGYRDSRHPRASRQSQEDSRCHRRRLPRGDIESNKQRSMGRN